MPRRQDSAGSHDGAWERGLLLLRALLASCVLLAAGTMAVAQEPSTPKDVATESLPLRTALHHDPTLVSPLQRLLSLYRAAGRDEQLIAVYRAHVAQYPTDVSARTVLVRLLAASGSPEAAREIQGAVAQFPTNSYLHYVLYEILRDKQDAAALDALDKAITLQTRTSRKVAWIDLLLPAAVVEDRRDLADKHLRALAEAVVALPGNGAQQRLEVAQRMTKHKFFEAALELLEKKLATPPAPETMVSIQLEAATAEVGLDKTQAAAARLDRLLGKLTADYWRRDEIVRRRLALVQSQAERDAMIGAARKLVEQNPRDEAAALDLAQVLGGLQLRRDALDVLIDAGRRLPKSARIEKQTLDMLDRLRDSHGREKYLAERIKQQPGRWDLVLLHVKTLYLLGRPGEALDEFDAAVEAMPAANRGKCLLEMARFLRRSTLVTDATELFRRVIELDPARLDVRRELAETYLATGERQRVRELFGESVSKKASLENLFDLVQFMIEQQLFAEARAAITGRLERDKENLDLRMLLLTIERRMGNFAAAEKLIAESRPLADTGARYRLWLEAAVTLHEDFDSVESFLQTEQSRLAEDPHEWTTRRLERRLAFAEISARSGPFHGQQGQQAAAMLESDLQTDPPRDARIKIRRQLIAILEKETGPLAAVKSALFSIDRVQKELEQLAAEDEQYADEHRARLALLHAKGQRQDLAVALLKKIDVTRIQDPAVLSALSPLCAQYPEGRKQILAILHRLTVLDASDRANWQRWLTALATSADEARLRAALRRLLAGVEKMPLADETRPLLQSHVADSYWRSIGRLLADEQETLLPEALAQLDAVERMAESDQQWLWVTWIRAYVLGRLGQDEARDEALDELQRVAGEIVQPAGSVTPDEAATSMLRIAFPDGLSISFDHARELLREGSPGRVHSANGSSPAVDREGPSPELHVMWDYQVDAQTPVSAIVPLGAERTLICDRLGGAHCLDSAGGKLIWMAEGILPMVPLPPSHNPNGNPAGMQQGLVPMPLADVLPGKGEGRFFVPGMSEVSCHAVDDGRQLWQAEVGTAAAHPPVTPAPVIRPYVSIFLYEGNLLTYEPASGTITKIDPATGKIVWDRTFAAQRPVMVGWHNSGASLCGNRLLVYGAQTAIVDLRSGELQWSFDPWRVRSFPIELRDPAIEESTPVVAGGYGQYPTRYPPQPSQYVAMQAQQSFSSGGFVYRTSGVSFSSRYAGPASQPTQFLNYLQTNSISSTPPGGVSLTGPAVAWASTVQRGAPRRAWLMDRQLLLFDSSGLQVVRTDLPLAGKRVSASGQFVGMAGRIACMLSGDELQFVDVRTGSVRHYNLQEVAAAAGSPDAGPGTPIQTAMDGPMVYVTGPGGILCVNAITGRLAFKADWPEELFPTSPPVTATASASYPPNVSAVHVHSGPVPVFYGGGGFGGGFGPMATLGGGSGPMATHNVPGAQAPVINCVDQGVLYAMLASNRVVALTQRR